MQNSPPEVYSENGISRYLHQNRRIGKHGTKETTDDPRRRDNRADEVNEDQSGKAVGKNEPAEDQQTRDDGIDEATEELQRKK